MTAFRRKIVAGNWKMNLDRPKAVELAASVVARAAEAGTTELVLCPPAVYVEAVGSAVAKSVVALGGQNMHDKASGAFTGEIAPAMLVDLGCRYVILGHSERRTLFGETDAFVNAKTKAALAAGLVPIVCVGETLEEREAGRTGEVVAGQVRGSLAAMPAATPTMLASATPQLKKRPAATSLNLSNKRFPMSPESKTMSSRCCALLVISSAKAFLIPNQAPCVPLRTPLRWESDSASCCRLP